MRDFAFSIFLIILTIVLLIAAIVGIGILTYKSITNEKTITTETIEAEITHLTMTDNYGHNYYVSIPNATFKITEQEFSSLKEGDIITVKITKTHNTKFSDYTEYRIGRN